MEITVINTLPVPSGQASVNRLLSYAKGLVNLGNNVTVMSSGFLSSSNQISDIDGVHVYNFGSGKIELFSLVGALCSMCKMLYVSRPDVIILVSNSLLLIWPLFFICKLKGIKFVQEKSEFPFSMMKTGLINRIYSKFYITTTYRLFDGLIVMTHPLFEFFSTVVRKKCKIHEMPMTVDTDRFSGLEKEESSLGSYIAYCGNLSNKKDGILNLIDAFQIVEKRFPSIKLLLIGGARNEDDMEIYRNEVNKRGLKNVMFYGNADREEMPRLLVDAKCLLLARPSSLQATGGFPTKLGEYLATGNPVVVTAVGDIPLYLNASNSYIVKPDDNVAFANQIIRVLEDPETSKKIGKEGQKMAETVFSAKEQSKRLDSYLKNLL